MIDLCIPTHMSTPLPLARGGPAPCMAATNSGAARLCLRPQPPRPTLPARAVPPHTRHRPVITRAAGPGVDSSGQKQGKEGEQGDGNAEDTSFSSPTSTSSLAVAAPDQSAFSNAVVTTFFVWAGGALFGLDPWAAARTEPLGASALAGLACAVPYIGFLAAVRALLGGVWWAEVEGHGALGALTPLRAFTFASGLAWSDTVAWRGLGLAAARKWVEAPAGAAAAAGAAGASSPAGGDPLALWSASSQAAEAAAASVASIAGTLAPPTPLPAAWLAPFLALGLGAAAAVAASYEPPGSFAVDSRAGDPTAPPLTLRELAWAYWREEEEEEEEEEGEEEEEEGGEEGEGGKGAARAGWAAGLATRWSGIKAAMAEVDAALDAASSSSPTTPAPSPSSSPATKATGKGSAPKQAPPKSGSGGFWENLLREDDDVGGDDSDIDFERLAAALDEAAGPPAIVTRWPPQSGPLRAWVVPTLVALEGAALAYEALATHSLAAPLITQGVGLGALWALEAAAAASPAPATPAGPVSDDEVAALFAGKPDLDTLIARARAAEAEAEAAAAAEEGK